MRISSVEKLKDQGSNGSPSYEFATKIAFEKLSTAASDWVGGTIWGSPAVALAPPLVSWKKRISARLSITKGAGDAMLSYPTNIDEIKNVLHKVRTNPQVA